MKNGIPFPVDVEFKRLVEKKRKEFIKVNGIKISQPQFMEKFITPTIKPLILKQRVNMGVFRHGRKKKNVF